ncbi:MAG: radical SAM protein [Clostridiales bacterium]|nr:radical SAM protein [Clostridiales bacterium]
MSEKAFRIGPIRPPSEANSLLIQVTNGCTWNKCRFCQLYRHTKFKAYSADSIRADIDNIAYWAERVRRYERPGVSAFAWDLEGINAELSNMTDADDQQCMYTVANWLVGGGENVFLQDGNSTALSSGRLSDVLLYLRQVFPQIKRITSYGRAENLSRSSAEEFAELKAAGLDRIHSGFETGSDAVLSRINKGVTQEQQIRAGKAIKAGGIELSIYFMPGVGGKDLSEDNAAGTAKVINAVNPDFVRVRTAAIKPGTELYQDWQEGKFQLCSDDDKVHEIRRVIEQADADVSTYLVSDHMINLLQDVEGSVISDRTRMLETIDGYLEMPEADRRAFQLLRRTLRAYNLDDMKRLGQAELDQLRTEVMKENEFGWDVRMNGYICRYV